MEQRYDKNMKKDRNIEKSENIERFMLLVFSAYVLALLCVIYGKNWDIWAVVVMIVGIVVSWTFYITKYKDYEFRTNFTSIMMQISVILYSVEMRDMQAGLRAMIAIAVFTGLYGIKELLCFAMVSTGIIVFYHGIILQSIHVEGFTDTYKMILEIANVFVVEGVIYFWVKKRNENNERLVKAIVELNETEHSKDDFMANVSHEIRTPINTICGMSEIILREDYEESMKEKVMRIHTAGQNLLSVVSDILDFSEIQSGKMEIVEEVYDITTILNDVINMSEVKKKEKHIELLIDCDATLPCGLLGDEKKIRRIMMNILSNALKFTEDGYVNLVIGYRREAYGLNLSITVKDSGIGMKEESLEKIFSSYSQVDTKRNRQEGGIGIGLAISQAMVQKMGGVLTIKSSFGKGTAIKFVIPQKILEDRPIIKLNNPEELNVLFYLDMEQFELPEVRDEYMSVVSHMIEKLKLKAHICKELGELKRRVEREDITHLFISIDEYRELKEYMDELAKKMKVIVVGEYAECVRLTNLNLIHIYKPFSVLTVVMALNGELKTAERKVKARRESKESFTAPNVRALVVDDNAMNLDVIQGLLSEYQIQVSVACSGLEALEKIDAMNYDFVFMDHMMPEMDGVETMRRIRKKIGNYFQRVPIIAVTANAVAGTREMFIAEGFADFIEKPVEVPVLERVLKRTIPEKKLVFVEEGQGKESQEKQSKKEEKALVVGDLDVKKGMMYCGGEEKYLAILRKFCINGSDNMKQLEMLFEKKDWKNYVIAVHAVKSSMYSIGALPLSEMAKQLEFAGKKENIEYIRQNHAAMLEEYKRVHKILQEHSQIGAVVLQDNMEEEQISEQEELTEEIFDEKFAELENAMFALDGDAMKEILIQLEKYQYHGNCLKKKAEAVISKVEMSDYMAALEQVRTWKQEDGKEDSHAGKA